MNGKNFAITGVILCTAMLCEAQQSFVSKPVDKPEDATSLVEKIRAQVPVQAIQSAGVLRVRTAGKPTILVPIHFSIRPISSNEWESEYVTDFTGQDNEKLVIHSYTDKPNEYTVAQKATGETTWNTKKIEPGTASVCSFAGTDFFYCDLGLEFLAWDRQMTLRQQMRKGRSCKVLESSHSQPINNAYDRVLSWIDNETCGVVMAQAFDGHNKRIKEFEIQSFKKVNGAWQLKQMTIFDNKKNSRTTLEIDLEFQEQISGKSEVDSIEKVVTEDIE